MTNPKADNPIPPVRSMAEGPCDVCGKMASAHMEIIGAGRVCPVSGTTFRARPIDQSAALLSSPEKLERAVELLRRDEGTLGETRRRLKHYGKSTSEIDVALSQIRDFLASLGDDDV